MSIIKQISLFSEKKTGRLTEVTDLLGDASINLSAFTIAESSDFGIMRVIVSDPDKAKQILAQKGIAVSLTDVICLQCPNTPGALNKTLQLLSAGGISVEYMYAFAVNEFAQVVIRPDKIQECISLLQENHYDLIKADDFYAFKEK